MEKYSKISLSLGLFFIGFLFCSCTQSIPKDALMLSPESLADRQLQTRVFETDDEKGILTAGAALLQDLGYTIDDSEVPCGVIVCSRDRDVTEAGQVVGAVLVAVLTGYVPAIDKKQKVIASLVTRPIGDNRIAVRITFQHMVWNTAEKLVKNETIKNPEVYQDFFGKLSKSVFLTAHEL